MIKIQNDLIHAEPNILCDAINRDAYVFKILYGQGFDIGQHENPNFVFAYANGLKDPKPNTIAFERIDGCQIVNRELLKNPNVLSFVKMYSYADPEINNLPCIMGREHSRYIEKNESQYEDVKQIEDKYFDKIQSGLNFLHYSKLDECEGFSRELDFNKDRNIDVFFAGTTEYGDGSTKLDKLISKHRKDCLSILHGIKGLTVCAIPNRAFDKRKYLNMLADSKVVISPWGYGEACYRDYEAAMCGCEVIKPMPYEIETIPGIYHNDFLTNCEPDWSDLEEIVKLRVREFDDRKEDRIEKSCRLIFERSPEVKAVKLGNIIKSTMLGVIINDS